MKKPAKGLSAALCALAAVMLAVVLLMTSVQLTGLNKNYFMRSHEKLGTAQRIGVSDADLEMITENLVDYLKGKREDLDMQAEIALRGNEREVFTEAKAGYEFRTAFVGKPAHEVHVVAVPMPTCSMPIISTMWLRCAMAS